MNSDRIPRDVDLEELKGTSSLFLAASAPITASVSLSRLDASATQLLAAVRSRRNSSRDECA